jgi:hypothetical protein
MVGLSRGILPGVVGAVVWIVVVLPSDARGQSLDIDDPDVAGAALTNCFHPGDRHVRTTFDLDARAATQALMACMLQCAGGLDGTPPEPATVPFHSGSGHTVYRGSVIGMNYDMHLALDSKFKCSVERTGPKPENWRIRIEEWDRIADIKDDKPPRSCSYESWQLADVHYKQMSDVRH